ncbi:MAG: hypothetical protein KC550_03960, partial [Nanoarchaeota archaeon]|nr:hypothetical protein [Nanoarchaeota archaeon]
MYKRSSKSNSKLSNSRINKGFNISLQLFLLNIILIILDETELLQINHYLNLKVFIFFSFGILSFFIYQKFHEHSHFTSLLQR